MQNTTRRPAQYTTDVTFELKTRADKLHLLFKRSFPAVFISIVNASLLVAALWPNVNHSKLKIWYAAILFASVFRTILFVNYKYCKPIGNAVISWEMHYFVTLIFSALVWGVGGLWLAVPSTTADQLIVICFLMGMAGGAISMYSMIRPIVLATVASVLLPVTVWFLMFGERAPRMAAIGCALFLVSCLRSTRIIGTALHQSFFLGHQLTHAKEQAEKIARTDNLTGLNNRGAFYELAGRQIAYCERHRSPLSLIAMDLDDFKAINDTYGHAVGDQTLRFVAEVIKSNIRTYDISVRMGGEEFVILLPNTSIEQAVIVAEKVRTAMIQEKISIDEKSLLVTASFGVAIGSYDIDGLLALADKALYEAKEAGKNRIYRSSSEASI